MEESDSDILEGFPAGIVCRKMNAEGYSVNTVGNVLSFQYRGTPEDKTLRSICKVLRTRNDFERLKSSFGR